MTRKQLISSREAVQAKAQHKKPCSDCPWSRQALNGWLGGTSADEWVRTAHSDAHVACHTLKGAQCAGIAVYRANVVKTPRDPSVLRLPADHTAVFSSPMEFTAHHSTLPTPRIK